MKKMFLFFSHTLNEEQKNDAVINLKIQEFIYLDENLQTLWSNIPTDILELEDVLIPFKNYIKKNITNNDIVLVQGDFGAVYNIVNFLKNLNIQSVYATTKRIVFSEYINEKVVKKSIFEHVMFRKYY